MNACNMKLFKVIAHRGANREALQNTLAAFEAAIDSGCDRIELDVHRTADDALVLYHDFEVAGKKIADTTYSQLSKHELSDGSKIATLDVALKLLDRVELNIEIKPTDKRTVEVLADYTKNKNLEKIVFSSFYGKALGHLKQHFPAETVAFLWGLEQLNMAEHPISHFSPQVCMHKYGLSIFHPKAEMVDRPLMEFAKNSGWLVYPWCAMADEQENREKLWGELIELGVNGLCTNEPRALRQYLDKLQKRSDLVEQGLDALPKISIKD